MRIDNTQRGYRSAVTQRVPVHSTLAYSRETPSVSADPASPACFGGHTRRGSAAGGGGTSGALPAYRPAHVMRPANCVPTIHADHWGRGGPGGAESPGFRVEAADLTLKS